MIENTEVTAEKPDFSLILNTLIPLFEEFDQTISNEHLFFRWENNSMPGNLEGVKAAAYFLKTYQINSKCLFEIIDERIGSAKRNSKE